MKFLSKILALVALFGTQLPLSAAPQPAPVLLYLAYAQASLLIHDADSAVAYLDQAASLIDPSDQEAPIYQFFLSFGQAIAFDQLGNRAACQQAIGALCLEMNRADGETESDYATSYSSQTAQLVVDFLRAIVATAPSTDVKALLSDLVDEIAEVMLYEEVGSGSSEVGRNDSGSPFLTSAFRPSTSDFML